MERLFKTPDVEHGGATKVLVVVVIWIILWFLEQVVRMIQAINFYLLLDIKTKKY